MAMLSVFNLITLDGFFKGKNEDISWHNFGEDEQQLADELSNRGNLLVFGRVTYQMMEKYWTSSDPEKNDPITTRGMNASPKLVFSKTLERAEWKNTRLVKTNMADEIRNLKKQNGLDMTILGSGQIVAQLSDLGLIDSYSILLNPLAIGEGAHLFKGLTNKLELKFKSLKTMKSGNVLLNYQK